MTEGTAANNSMNPAKMPPFFFMKIPIKMAELNEKGSDINSAKIEVTTVPIKNGNAP